MKKSVFIFFLFVKAFSAQLWAGTFFLYIEEQCNGERGMFLYQARIGILDTFFEDGHIIFDDLSDKAIGTHIASQDVVLPLATARKGGAEYLIAVAIDSTAVPLSKTSEKINSTCAWYVYETGTGRLLGKGSLSLANEGSEHEMNRNKLWFELGRQVAFLIEKSL